MNIEKKSGFAHEEAILVRNVIKYKTELLENYKWLPFPQNCCCFSFIPEGNYDREFPLSIGVITYLWDNWKDFTGTCPECGGKLYGFGFGGLLSTGGVPSCCIDCEWEFFRFIGGLQRVGDTAQDVLKSSPYRINTGRFGGAFGGSRIPLVRALRILGSTDLPNDDWCYQIPKTEVSFTVNSKG